MRRVTLLHGVKRVGAPRSYIFILKIQTTDPNRSIWSPYWNVLGDQILHFLKFVYYLLSHFENHWSNGPEIFTVFYCSLQNSNFQNCLINSKKFPKNVKFSFQAHFNMENMLEGSNRLFGFSKWKYGVEYKCILLHDSP